MIVCSKLQSHILRTKHLIMASPFYLDSSYTVYLGMMGSSVHESSVSKIISKRSRM